MVRWTTQRFYWAFLFSSIASIFVINGIAIMVHQPNTPCICKQCPEDPSITDLTLDDVTFFTIPKPHLDNESLHKHLLAYSSWLSASPRAKVRLYIEEKDYDPKHIILKAIDKNFGKGRLSYGGYTRSLINGVPYIDDWFRRGIHDATTKLAVFINADILISPEWYTRVKQCFTLFPTKPLVLINQRLDFDMSPFETNYAKLRMNPEYLLQDIEAMVENSQSEPHSPLGIDTFTFRIDLLPLDPEKILPFIIGRYNWDNWLIGYLNRIAETVTFNLDPPVYHINHIRHRFDASDPKVLVNHHLRNGNKKYFGSNLDTKYQILDGKLVMRYTGIKYNLPRI